MRPHSPSPERARRSRFPGGFVCWQSMLIYRSSRLVFLQQFCSISWLLFGSCGSCPGTCSKDVCQPQHQEGCSRSETDDMLVRTIHALRVQSAGNIRHNLFLELNGPPCREGGGVSFSNFPFLHIFPCSSKQRKNMSLQSYEQDDAESRRPR